MASWIKERDGIEWYDEAYTCQQTNQSPEQLEKKAKAGKIRRFKQRNAGFWYARPDVESLREAFLKRSAAAKGRKLSDAQLEARYTRGWEKDLERSRQQRVAGTYKPSGKGGGPVAAAQERSMLRDIEAVNDKRKT